MRADRLVAILLLLQQRQKVTADEVAAELEISSRTARRDLEALGVAGLPVTLCVAAGAMGLGIFLARPFPLRVGEVGEVTPGTPWEELFVVAEPNPDDGPIAVELGYRIRAGEAQEFLNAVALLRSPRRRDGATFWRVYRDLGDASRYVERFIVTSWADYLHQRARATVADQELEARVREFLEPGESVSMQHYIAER